MFKTSRVLRTLACGALIASFGVALGTGCKKKPKPPEEISVDARWQTTSDLLASRVGADVHSVVFVNDFTKAFVAYQGLRERVAAYAKDLATIEADLRNTLGVDPVRPQKLSDIGVNPEGGAFCATTEITQYCGILVSDSARFEAHVRTVLAAQPFNLRAPVGESELPGGGKLLRFAAEENGPVRLAIIMTEGFAFVVPDVSDTNLEGLAASLEGPLPHSLRDSELYQQALTRMQGESAWLWMSPLAAKKQLQSLTMLGSALPSMDNVKGAVVSLQIASDALHGRLFVAVDPNDARVRAALQPAAGIDVADFTPFVENDAYLMLRARADVQSLAQIFRGNADEATIENAQNTLSSSLGGLDIATLETKLAAALGSDMLIVATRARLLTIAALARGGEPNARALGDGLGLIAAYQLRDEDAGRELLQWIAEQNPALLQFTKGEDAPDRWVILQGKATGTILTIGHDALVATTERQMGDVTRMLARDDKPELSEISAEEARALRAQTQDIGIFVDLKRVANNAIGTIASGKIPNSMKDAVQVFDEFWMRAELKDGWLDGTWRIQLSTPARQ